jgi:hypothetical protein
MRKLADRLLAQKRKSARTFSPKTVAPIVPFADFPLLSGTPAFKQIVVLDEHQLVNDLIQLAAPFKRGLRVTSKVRVLGLPCQPPANVRQKPFLQAVHLFFQGIRPLSA